MWGGVCVPWLILALFICSWPHLQVSMLSIASVASKRSLCDKQKGLDEEQMLYVSLYKLQRAISEAMQLADFSAGLFLWLCG